MRDRTGEGQAIEVSLLQIGLYIQGNDMSNVLATGQSPPMHDRRAPRNPLWNYYPTADERWLMLVMVESQRYWPNVCRALELGELERDARFADPVARYRNGRALVERLDAVFARAHPGRVGERAAPPPADLGAGEAACTR